VEKGRAEKEGGVMFVDFHIGQPGVERFIGLFGFQIPPDARDFSLFAASREIMVWSLKNRCCLARRREAAKE